jgi:hypothetical protein
MGLSIVCLASVAVGLGADVTVEGGVSVAEAEVGRTGMDKSRGVSATVGCAVTVVESCSVLASASRDAAVPGSCRVGVVEGGGVSVTVGCAMTVSEGCRAGVAVAIEWSPIVPVSTIIRTSRVD